MTKKHLCTFDPSCFIFPFENKFSINIAINSCNLKLILINQTISDNLSIILNSDVIFVNLVFLVTFSFLLFENIQALHYHLLTYFSLVYH